MAVTALKLKARLIINQWFRYRWAFERVRIRIKSAINRPIMLAMAATPTAIMFVTGETTSVPQTPTR